MTRKRRSLSLGSSTRPTLPNCGATGKRCYRSERLAIDAHRHAGFRVHTYRCPHCRWIHASNTEKSS